MWVARYMCTGIEKNDKHTATFECNDQQLSVGSTGILTTSVKVIFTVQSQDDIHSYYSYCQLEDHTRHTKVAIGIIDLSDPLGTHWSMKCH